MISCFDFSGGKKILLFCEKVDKNDVEVHFTLYTKSKHGYLEIHMHLLIYSDFLSYEKRKYVFISSNYIKGGEPVTCKGEFTASGVHKQFGISFKTPKYPNQSIREDVRVS